MHHPPLKDLKIPGKENIQEEWTIKSKLLWYEHYRQNYQFYLLWNVAYDIKFAIGKS